MRLHKSLETRTKKLLRPERVARDWTLVLRIAKPICQNDARPSSNRQGAGANSPGFYAVPIPCRFDDCFETVELRHPCQHSPRLHRTSDENVRIARTSVGIVRSDLPAGNPFRRVNHLPYRKPITVAQVEGIAWLSGLQMTKAEHMGVRQIRNVNLVTNAGSIRCRIVRAVNLDAVA